MPLWERHNRLSRWSFALLCLSTSGCFIPGGGWTMRSGCDLRVYKRPALFLEMVDSRWDETNRLAQMNAMQACTIPPGNVDGIPPAVPMETIVPLPASEGGSMPTPVVPPVPPSEVPARPTSDPASGPNAFWTPPDSEPQSAGRQSPPSDVMHASAESQTSGTGHGTAPHGTTAGATSVNREIQPPAEFPRPTAGTDVRQARGSAQVPRGAWLFSRPRLAPRQ